MQCIKTIIKLVFQMSSSSARSARSSASASTSYTYGVPGSQVKISLDGNGNHSLTLSRGPNLNSKTSSSVPVPVADRKFPDGWVGPANTPFCKVCYDAAGLAVADYTDHFVKDQPGPNGKVVCPTLLAQKCLKCGVAGHTSSYCPEEARLERERKERDRHAQRVVNGNGVNEWKVVGGGGASAVVSTLPAPIPLTSASKAQNKTAAPAVHAVAAHVARGGSFGLLAVDEQSDDSEYEREQEEVRNTPAGIPKPVIKERPILTGPPPAVEPAKPLTWAQRAAAAAAASSTSSKTSSVAVGAAAAAAAPLADTRFQLHSLCDRVEMSKRASSAKKVAAASAANHRGNAASIARESSLKRKQDSVTIPA